MTSEEFNKEIGRLFQYNKELEKKMEKAKSPEEMVGIQIEARQNLIEIRNTLLKHPGVDEEIKDSIRGSDL
ncbi:MAG: hypothetical protein ACLFNW_10640 [Desulfobacterales bacterium]